MTPGGRKVAVVLSGGGADGAYEVGVLKALMSGAAPSTGDRPLDPDIFAGTSIGAFNASYLASHWEEYGNASVAGLESVWSERVASRAGGQSNGFYRMRGDPTRWLDPRRYAPNPLAPPWEQARDATTLGWDGIQRAVHFASSWDESLAQRMIEMFNVSSFVCREPFEKTVREVVNYDGIRRTSKILKICATNWATGELRTFTNAEMSADLGPQAILASGAVPGFFPPVDFGALPYVDGGVLLNTPLKPAIAAGADVLHVMYLDPDIKTIPMSHIKNTLETFYRMNQIAWAFAINDDIEDAGEINRGLKLIQAVAAGGELNGEDAEALIRVASTLAERLPSMRYRPLTIHRYHPRDDLGGDLGFLNLEYERIANLIEKGFQDGAHHDCRVSGCILPTREAG